MINNVKTQYCVGTKVAVLPQHGSISVLNALKGEFFNKESPCYKVIGNGAHTFVPAGSRGEVIEASAEYDLLLLLDCGSRLRVDILDVVEISPLEQLAEAADDQA